MKVTIWHRQGLFDQAPPVLIVSLGELFNDLFVGYRPGDPIKAVYEYTLEINPNHLTPDQVKKVLDQAFRMFNDHPHNDWERQHAERYHAQNRPLDVGDVVVIGEIALTPEPDGWVFVTPPPEPAG